MSSGCLAQHAMSSGARACSPGGAVASAISVAAGVARLEGAMLPSIPLPLRIRSAVGSSACRHGCLFSAGKVGSVVGDVFGPRASSDIGSWMAEAICACCSRLVMGRLRRLLFAARGQS